MESVFRRRGLISCFRGAYLANNFYPFNYFDSAEEGRPNELVIVHIFIYLNEKRLGNGGQVLARCFHPGEGKAGNLKVFVLYAFS